MSETRFCPKCQAPIPLAAPAGLCPNCLLAAGVESLSPSDVGVSPTQSSPAGGGERFVPPSIDELAPRFPQLEFLELLGQGGMGAVYKARQRGLDRLVAVKILPPEISRDPTFAERFTREARALGKLNHPHIVAVHDSGQTADGLCYFVMEFVDGVNLRQAIRAGRMTPKDALAIVPQICDALQFAHDAGIVHRDIKPENVLVDKQGRVKIADFGLAKLLGLDGAQHTLTATQQVMGTLRYMAPEQMEGTKDVDHRADIFSLGVVFYELLTGELPVGRFAPPSKKVQIDVRLDEVVLRTLEQNPEQRYQHASDVKSNVEAIVRTSVGETPTDIERQILAMAEQGRVAAVKRYMELTGTRLVEAKKAVEEIGERHQVSWLAASPFAEWGAFVLILVTLIGSISLSILRPLQISSVITVPFVFVFAVVPLAIRLWRTRGTREGHRDLLLIASVLALLFFSSVVSFLSNPAPTLERIYALTGIAPGQHDAIFLQSMFLIGVFAILIWLLRFWSQLRSERHGDHASRSEPDVNNHQPPANSLTPSAPQTAMNGRNSTSSTSNLQQLLGVALGLVLGAFCVTVGVLLFAAAFLFSSPGLGAFWGWMGGAIGCLGGGLGSIAGSWNTYRQQRGEIDWLKSPRWTMLDTGCLVYGVVGAVLLLAGPPFASALAGGNGEVVRMAFHGARLIGGLMLFQAMMFLIYRGSLFAGTVTGGVAPGLSATTGPNLARRTIKFTLWFATLIAVLMLVSFQMQANRQKKDEVMTITIGAIDPWFTLTKTHKGSDPATNSSFGWTTYTSINALTWSCFAFAVLLVCGRIAWRMEKEDDGKIAFDPKWWRTVLIQDGVFTACYFLVVLLASTWRTPPLP